MCHLCVDSVGIVHFDSTYWIGDDLESLDVLFSYFSRSSCCCNLGSLDGNDFVGIWVVSWMGLK